MPTMNELNEAVYRGRFDDQMSKGADAAKKAMSALGDAVVTTDEKVKRAEKSFGQIERRYDESAKRTAALAKATREYESAVRAATAAVEAGAKTQAEADEVLKRASLVRDAAFAKADAAAEKQKALYSELEQMSGRNAAAYQKWAEATRTVTQAQERFNQLLGVRLPDSASYEKRADDVRAYGRGLDELRARITPLYAAELQFKDSLELVNHALKSGAVNMTEAQMATERYRVTLEGAARAATAASQVRFNGLAGITLPDDANTASRAADVAAYGRALDDLRARINPVYAAELQFERAQAEVNQALKVGAISAREARVAVADYANSLRTAQQTAAQLAQARFNELTGISLPDAKTTASRAEDMLALGRSMDATRAKYVPLVAEMQRYEKELLEVRNAEKLGILTAQEAASARAKLLANYTDATKVAEVTTNAHARMGRQVHLTSNQLVQLSYQLNDVIAQSAVGTSPFIILAQQGPQVAQALGGWTASLRMLLSVMNPVTIAAGLLVAAIAIPVAVANSNEARLSSMRNALRAYREDYRQTADYLNSETRRIALASPGFGLGDVTDSAKTIERARVVSQLTTPLAELTRLAQDLSKTLDTDLASASERVARAMRDPAAVAKELAENGFPGVTEAVRRQIEVLQRAGERQQAFTILQTAMNEQLRGAARDVSPLAAAWQNLTKVMSEFWEVLRPGLELVGQGIIVWVRNLFGYLERIRNVISEIRDVSNNPVSPVAGAAAGAGGGAWAERGGSSPTTLRDAIGRYEGADNYGNQRNPYGYLGRYQFGVQALEDAGMYTRTELERRTGANNWNGTWNYPGVTSREDFLANPGAQDAAYERYMVILNRLVDRLNIQPGATVNGQPVSREALLAVGWGMPANMAEVLAGRAGRPDGNGVTGMERYLSFSRLGVVAANTSQEQYGPALPSGTSTAIAAQGQAQIDEMTRRARDGYGGNQQPSTRQNAAADMQGFARAREQLEAQNEELRRQMEILDPTSDAWANLNRQLTTNNSSIEVLNAGMDGARASLRTTLSPVEELLRGWERSAEGARDAGSGAAFVRDRLRELNETSMRSVGTSASLEDQQRATASALSELDAQYRNVNAQLDRQITGNERIAASSAQGAAAMSQQEAIERAREEVRKTTLAGTSAEAVAIENLATRYLRLATVEAERQTARRTVDRQQELDYIQREVDLIGVSADRRERELAALKERQAILRADPNADLNSDVNRRAISSAEQLASTRVEADRLQASFNELASFGSRAFDRIGSAITEAFANGTMSTIKWGNIARAVLSEMIQLAIRLALINPLMNWTFGQNNPTLLSAAQSTGSMLQGNPLGSGGGGSSGLLNQAQQLGGVYRLFSGNSTSGGGMFSGISNWLASPAYGVSGGYFGTGIGALSFTGGATAVPAGFTGGIGSLAATPTAASTGLGSAFGATSAATIGGTLAGGAAGIGLGYMGGTMVGGMLAQTDAQRENVQYGSGGGALAGAAAGAVIGSVVPVIGTAIGALIGGIVGGTGGGALGGVIGPSNEFKGGDVGIGVADNGQFYITGAGGKRWNEWGARESTQKMLQPINDLLQASGIKVQGAGGFNWDRAGGAETLGFSGFGGSFNTLGPNELFQRVRPSLKANNQTTQALIDRDFIKSWEDLNKTAGFTLSDNQNMRTALKSSGVNSVDDVGAAYNFITGIYEPLNKAEEQVSSWQQRIKAIHDTFLPAIETAQRYGLATEGLTAKMDEAVRLFHEDHALIMKDINDSMAVRKLTAQASLATDPIEKITLTRKAALIQFDAEAIKQRKQLETSLKDLYVNVWNPAEYNRLMMEQDQVSALERLALWQGYQDQITQIEEKAREEERQAREEERQRIEQAQEEERRRLEQAQEQARTSLIGVITGLADYASGLRAGDKSPLSPMGRLDSAESQFDSVYAKAKLGDFNSLSKLSGVSDQYLSMAREIYGGGIGYAQIFDEVVQALQDVSTVSEDTLTASAMAAIMQDTKETLSEELTRLIDEVKKLSTEVRQNNIAPTGA